VLSPERVLEAHELEPVLEVVRRHRGIEDTDARAAQHVQRAADAIAAFADGGAKEALVAAAQYALERDR
jgi:octaprenyl-diphosphate synthase